MKRAMIGIALGLIGAGLFTYELIEVMKIGTCASGGPFVSARQCPAGTGADILLLSAGILISIAGMFVGGGMSGAGLFSWCALFLSSGIGMLAYSIAGHNVSSGAQDAGYIVGGIFIPMGGLPLIWLIASGIRGLGERRQRARSKESDATVSRVEELQHFGLAQARIRVTYAVQPLDDASFELSRETNVLMAQMPRQGQQVRLRYDPLNHQRFELISVASASFETHRVRGGELSAPAL